MEEDVPNYDSDIVDSDIEISLYSQIHFEENSNDDSKSKDAEFMIHVDGNDNSGYLAPADTRGILLNRSIGLEKGDENVSLYLEHRDNGNEMGAMSKRKLSKESDGNRNMNNDFVETNDTKSKIQMNSDCRIYPEKDPSYVKTDWNVNKEDRPNAKPKPHARRYYKYFRCLNCNEVGHMSKTCPLPKKQQVCGFCSENGHSMRDCPESICFNCLGTGHVSRECPHYRRGGNQLCFRCHRPGHQKMTCPDQWRQYHNTVESGKLVKGKNRKRKRVTYCFNCAGDDHLGHECNEERMHWRVNINSPFIVRYQVDSNNHDFDSERQWKKPRYEDCNDSTPVNKKTSVFVPIKKKDNSYTGRNNFDNMQLLKQIDADQPQKKNKKKTIKKKKKKIKENFFRLCPS